MICWARALHAKRRWIERVHARSVSKIGSQTVMEIAISITAELVAHRNLGSAPGSARQRPSLAAELG